MKKGTKHIKTVIKEALEMVVEGKDPFTKDVQKKPAQEHLVARLLARALSGDKKAADMLLDRYYGKPTQTIDQNVSVESHEDRLQKIIAAEQEREDGLADQTHH